MSAVLVTGATGNVGSALLRLLSERGTPAVAALTGRHFDADGKFRDRGAVNLHGAQPRHFAFEEPETWDPALHGVDRIFLLRPPHISRVRRDMVPFLERVRARGIDQVVFLSVQGAESNALVPHHAIEEAVRRLGLPCTFLRPSFFMQNLTTTHLPEIRDESRIFVPAGTGRTNFVDVRDIALAASIVLHDPRAIGQAYTLTGDRSYSYGEVAEILSDVTGRRVRYDSPGLFSFATYHLRRGRTLGQTVVMYALYSVARMGKADGTTDELERLIGRSPRSLPEFADDHRGELVPTGG